MVKNGNRYVFVNIRITRISCKFGQLKSVMLGKGLSQNFTYNHKQK